MDGGRIDAQAAALGAHGAGVIAERERPLVNDYNHFRTISSIGFIAGGVVAATGVVLLLTAPRSSEPRAALWLGVGSLGVIGEFQ